MRSSVLVALILGALTCWLVFALTRGATQLPVVAAASAASAAESLTEPVETSITDRREATGGPESPSLLAPGGGFLPGQDLVWLMVAVIDQEGRPILRASIQDGLTGANWAVTDSAGQALRVFTPTRMLRGAASLQVRAPGYSPTSDFVASSFVDRRGEVQVRTFTLRRTGVLLGRVWQHAGGLPASYATVIAVVDSPEVAQWMASSDPIPWGTRLPTSCDEQGRYRLESIEAGVYRIGASQEGLRWAWSGRVVVEVGQKVTVGDLTLDAPASPRPVLVGRVLDSHGAPVAGAHVSYDGARGKSGYRTANESGEFSIPGASGAELILHVSSPRVGLGGGQGVGHVGAGPVEVVLPNEPVLVVRFVLPEGIDASTVRLRSLDVGGGLVLAHPFNSSDEARLRWPARAVTLEARMPRGKQAALVVRVQLPLRPLEGEQEVELVLD